MDCSHWLCPEFNRQLLDVMVQVEQLTVAEHGMR
jgi:hypothetical protein